MKNIGIIGIGDISGIYLENITKMFREIQILAICDLVKSKAEKAQEKYNIPKLYDTMYQVFEDPDIDIVLNLTRPYEHFDVTKAALEHGKHVYSEKPLAATFAEGKELVKLAQEKDLMLGGAPDTFMGAGIQSCRKLIEDGVIGDVIGGAAFMICRGHESWHPDPEFYYKHGGGPMLDMGPYYVTAFINLLGGVKSVTGVTKTTFPERIITSEPHLGETIHVDVPTYITGILQFENGAVGTLFTTFDVVNKGQARFEIYGSEGTLIIPDPNTFGGPIKLLHRMDDEQREMPLTFDYKENSRALGLADMAKSLETGRRCRTTYKQTLHVLEIMESFQKSSDLRKTVDLETKFVQESPMKNNPVRGILD
ncbi:MAG: Gfo/Idh/MocA family oxidoreductase [Oscillospiraceae bacterium]